MSYDDRISIPTPEGVELELVLAGVGSRLVATLVDLLIKLAVLFALWFVGTVGLFVASIAMGGTRAQSAVSTDTRAKYESARAYDVFNAGGTKDPSQSFYLVAHARAGTVSDPSAETSTLPLAPAVSTTAPAPRSSSALPAAIGSLSPVSASACSSFGSR